MNALLIGLIVAVVAFGLASPSIFEDFPRWQARVNGALICLLVGMLVALFVVCNREGNERVSLEVIGDTRCNNNGATHVRRASSHHDQVGIGSTVRIGRFRRTRPALASVDAVTICLGIQQHMSSGASVVG